MYSLTELPLFEKLRKSERILLAGAGGGFDIYCGIPLYLALKQMGKEVWLANLSFTYLPTATSRKVFENCYWVRAGDTNKHPVNYFPEKYLADWFLQEQKEQVGIYSYELSGVQTLKSIYNYILDAHQIDTIVLVDGGTDSLMAGDEEQLGTPLEDSCSLVAADLCDAQQKLLVCLGFGVDSYHGVSHYRFLENTARLMETNGFLGSFSLLPSMPEVQKYISAVGYVNQRMDKKSIVANSIVSAIEGRFGDYHRTQHTVGSELWINPLMCQYWSYQVEEVARHLKYYGAIVNSYTRSQLNMGVFNYRQDLADVRENKRMLG